MIWRLTLCGYGTTGEPVSGPAQKPNAAATDAQRLSLLERLSSSAPSLAEAAVRQTLAQLTDAKALVAAMWAIFGGQCYTIDTGSSGFLQALHRLDMGNALAKMLATLKVSASKKEQA